MPAVGVGEVWALVWCKFRGADLLLGAVYLTDSLGAEGLNKLRATFKALGDLVAATIAALTALEFVDEDRVSEPNMLCKEWLDFWRCFDTCDFSASGASS